MVFKVSSIGNLSPEAIQCRAWRHYWKPLSADPMTIKRQKGYYVTLQCGRGCGVSRHFFLSMKGEYGPSTYTYGENFLLDHRADMEERTEIKTMALVDLLNPEEDTTVVKLSSRKGSK